MPRVIPSVTVVDVTLGDLIKIEVSRQSDGSVSAHTYYEVLTDQGDPHHTGELVQPLAGSSFQSLKAWVDAHVIPPINAQEGMVP